MARVNVATRVDRAGIAALMRGPNGAAAQAAIIKGQRVLNAARQTCPVDEGRLRASLTMEVVTIGDVVTTRIGSNLEYIVYVHEGTGIYGPHGTRIVPRNATVLRWPVKNNSGTGRRRYRGGQTANFAFARSVKGVKGRPFLREALRAARG